MIRLYGLLGKVLRPIMMVFFYLYNHLTHTQRARIIVCNEENEVLLLQNWIGVPGWGLPGGGIKKVEEPQHAAQRELYEETGIMADSERMVYIATLQASGYQTPIYQVTVQKSELPAKLHNPWEIVEVSWFSFDALPDLASHAKKALEKFAVRS